VKKPPPLLRAARSEFQCLAFIVDLVAFILLLGFIPRSRARQEEFMVTLLINKDGP